MFQGHMESRWKGVVFEYTGTLFSVDCEVSGLGIDTLQSQVRRLEIRNYIWWSFVFELGTTELNGISTELENQK